MNRDDIISMAKQAGGREARNPELYDCFIMSLDDLERLYHHAAAAKEREMQARVDALHAMYEQACRHRDQLMDERRDTIAAMRGKIQ